jgi:hypothetical protein
MAGGEGDRGVIAAEIVTCEIWFESQHWPGVFYSDLGRVRIREGGECVTIPSPARDIFERMQVRRFVDE